jgi:uncharacterized protein (DUF1684 family)
MFDPEPTLPDFKGWIGFSRPQYLRAPTDAEPEPDTVIIQSTRGNWRAVRRLVRLQGRWQVVPSRSVALLAGVARDFSVFFRDKTTGGESYGGRYIDLARCLMDVSFSTSIWPTTRRAPATTTRPIPPRANQPVAIKAGKDKHCLLE